MAQTKPSTATKKAAPRAGAAQSKPAAARKPSAAAKAPAARKPAASKAAAATKPRTASKAATTTTSRAASKPATAAKPRAATTAKPRAASKAKAAVDKTTQLSEEVLDSVQDGQRAAVDAVRKFVDTVDQALPGHGDGPSRRQDVVDAAMEMADRLIHTQYDFIRKVIDSAGRSFKASDDKQ